VEKIENTIGKEALDIINISLIKNKSRNSLIRKERIH
jgi:hypothetical protein